MSENLCGECRMCCKNMPVDDLDPPKPDNTWCINVVPELGCGIYEARPKSCRDYECLWLQSQRREGVVPLPASLRPDRCKVIMNPFGDKVVLKVDAHRPDAYRTEPVQAFLKHLLRGGARILVARGDQHYVMHEVLNKK